VPTGRSPVDDQAGVLEHAQVLGDRRSADRQLGGQLADRPRSASQQLEDRAPGWVTQNPESGISVSPHER
jgi:hypothetical protein